MATENLVKVYCTCNGAEIGPYYGLAKAGPAKDGSIIFVHWPCGKPSVEVWRYWRALCDDCWRGFSSPWEWVCRRCSTASPYKGWRYAREVS